jgi:hypothetical protein
MKTLFTAALLSAAALAPSLAKAADYPVPQSSQGSYAGSAYGLPYPISFMHNYGPGREPGTFVYYDGPPTNRCYQSAAAYIGQDGRRHPCF